MRLTPEAFIVLGPPGPDGAQLGSMQVSSFRPVRVACIAD